MRIDELETGMILHFAMPDGEVDIECAVTDCETEFVDDGDEADAVRPGRGGGLPPLGEDAGGLR